MLRRALMLLVLVGVLGAVSACSAPTALKADCWDDTMGWHAC